MIIKIYTESEIDLSDRLTKAFRDSIQNGDACISRDSLESKYFYIGQGRASLATPKEESAIRELIKNDLLCHIKYSKNDFVPSEQLIEMIKGKHFNG